MNTVHAHEASPHERGYTLVEMGIVIFILALAAGFLVPKLRGTAHQELLSNARRLAVSIRYARQEAILDGRTYRLFYDLQTHRYWLETASDDSDEPQFKKHSGKLGEGIALPEEVGFSDVVLPFAGGIITEGQTYTDFYPNGEMDLTVVHLDNGEEAYTIRLEPLSGAVFLTEGYQNFEFGV